MPISCMVEIEGAPDGRRNVYNFAELPRIGEIVVMDWDGDRYPGHVVYGVRHIPEGIENEIAAYTVIYLRKAAS